MKFDGQLETWLKKSKTKNQTEKRINWRTDLKSDILWRLFPFKWNSMLWEKRRLFMLSSLKKKIIIKRKTKWCSFYVALFLLLISLDMQQGKISFMFFPPCFFLSPSALLEPKPDATPTSPCWENREDVN